MEVIFTPDSPSLFKQPESFWEKLTRSCGAEIVSRSKFPSIHSYILSESSLLVWKRRLILITCGRTALSKSLIKILKSFPPANIEVCFFQRKNEFFPQIQKSCFSKDLRKIRQKISGQAYRFGLLHDHHFFLFHSESDFIPDERDQTLEILIYESETVKDSSPQTIFRLKKELEKAFYGFEIQEHFFDPFGYSLNAVRGDLYYVLHITPEKPVFYISFETNIKDKSVSILTHKILNVFRPGRFDFIFFEPHSRPQEAFDFPDYFSSSFFYQTLACGYNVTYKSFHEKSLKKQTPSFVQPEPI